MRRDEVVNLIKHVPDVDVSKLVLVVRSGSALNIETVFRCEPSCLVFRGRESGTNDDGRGFFVPYEEIVYVKLERVVTVQDLEGIFGADPDDNSADDPFADATGTTTPAPAKELDEAVGLDPAAIAKNNLLERIRAARTSAGVPKPGGK